MAGTMIELCPPRLFDFAMVQGSAGDFAMNVTVAERINARRWTEGALIVRVHSVEIQEAQDSITVQATPEWFTYEDPTGFFAGPTAATVRLTSSMTGTSLLSQALAVPFGPLLRVDVNANRNFGAAAPLKAMLAIALLLKTNG